MKRPACVECRKPFTATSARVAPQQKYCSNKCKMANYWRRRFEKEAEAERRKGERRATDRRKSAA